MGSEGQDKDKKRMKRVEEYYSYFLGCFAMYSVIRGHFGGIYFRLPQMRNVGEQSDHLEAGRNLN